MEVFDLSRRGTAKDFLTKKIGVLVVTMLYPAVISYCYHNLEKDAAIKMLKKLGANIMDDFLRIYTGKRANFGDYIKDFFKIFYESTVQIKKISEDLYHVHDKDCILCTEIGVEGLPFHYCTPYSGSIGRMLEVFAEKGKIPVYNYEVETISSKGIDGNICIHEIRLRRR